MDFIELEHSTISALKYFGSIEFEGETINLPRSTNVTKDALIVFDRGAGSDKRWRSEGISAYIILHTMKDGRKIAMPFDDVLGVVS